MTSAVAAQPKKNKFRKDHKINWWLTAVVAVLSLTILVPLYFTIVTAADQHVRGLCGGP